MCLFNILWFGLNLYLSFPYREIKKSLRLGKCVEMWRRFVFVRCWSPGAKRGLLFIQFTYSSVNIILCMNVRLSFNKNTIAKYLIFRNHAKAWKIISCRCSGYSTSFNHFFVFVGKKDEVNINWGLSQKTQTYQLFFCFVLLA